MNFIWMCLMITAMSVANVISVDKLTVEHQLVEDILSNYEKGIRPTDNTGDVTHVYIELSLFDVLDMNTKEQTMSTNTELIFKWVDHNLVWKPEIYSNISVIRLPAEEIWNPDIILYNTADADYEAGLVTTNVIIQHDGLIELITYGLFRSVCNMDVQYYPFDQQTCMLRFAPWSNDETQIHLVLGPADMSEYQPNPTFFLENFYAAHERLVNPCCDYPMSAVIYYIQMQRRTKFSMFFFIMPGILINIAALLVFSLPSESGEKVVLGISAMLAMLVFLMRMTDYLPPTDQIPLLGVFYGTCLSLTAMNIVLSIVVLNMNVAGQRKRRVPPFLRKTTINLIKVFKNKIPLQVANKWKNDEERENKLKENLSGSFIKVQPLDFHSMIKSGLHFERSDKPKMAPYKYKEPYMRRMVNAMDDINYILESNIETQLEERDEQVFISEWKFISRVFDRFLFYTFIMGLLMINFFLFLSSPFSITFDYCPVEQEKCEGMTRDEILEWAHSGVGHAQASGTGGH